MVNTRLAKAYKSLMEAYEKQGGLGVGIRKKDEIKQKMEECNDRLRQQHKIGHDEQMIALIDSVLSDESIKITSDNLDVILSGLSDNMSKEYYNHPLEVKGDLMSFSDVGRTYKRCQVDLESIDVALLLDRHFMEGYIREYSDKEETLDDRPYGDADFTNQDVINHVNSLCDEVSR